MYLKNFFVMLAVNLLCAVMLMGLNNDLFGSGGCLAFASHSGEALTEDVAMEKYDSGQRMISYDYIEPAYCVEASDEDVAALMKLVEAEAGCEDRTGKLLVANVVINRVKSERFPDTIKEVIYQRVNNTAQFSPVSTGSIDRVTVSEETREAVYSALEGEDASRGAMYFMARRYSDSSNVKWFDTHLDFLFSYGGHEFYG